MDNYIEQFVNTSGYASSTSDFYKRILDWICQDVGDLEGLTASRLRTWLDSRHWSNSTQWSALCVVRAFLRWRYGAGHPALTLRIKRLESPPQRVLKLDQVKCLLWSFDTSGAKGRRDLAMCALLLDSGLRAAEVCRLEMSCLDLIERRLQVRVKGGRIQEAVYSEYTASCLLRWFGDRESLVKLGVVSVFVGVGGSLPGRGMTTGGLRAEMRKWAVRAGLKALSPHDLRRTFATQSIRLGAPSRIVQIAGRWKDLAMVERYTRSLEASDFDRWFPVAAAMA